MPDPFHGRSKNPRLRLIIGVLLLFVPIVLVVYQSRWVSSVLEGPVAISGAALEEIEDPRALANPWVSFTFNEAIDSGLVMESTRAGKTRQRSKYLLIHAGGHWLIADVPAGFTGNHLIGYLDAWRTPLSRQVIDQIKTKFPDRAFLPYQLNAEYSYRGECYALLGSAALIFFVALMIIVYAWSDLGKLKRLAAADPLQGP